MTPSLTIIGDLSVDLVMGPLAEWPRIGTETIVARSQMRAGGSGANCAFASVELGQRTTLVAAHGGDDLGRWVAAQCAGLDARLAALPGLATTVSVGLIHSCAERTFLTTPGHLGACAWSELQALVPAPAAPGSIALLTGTFLLPRLREEYLPMMARLRECGYRIALDTGWPSQGWTPAIRAQCSGWLALCDHLLLNEAEVTALSGEPELRTALQTLSRLMPPDATVVAKLGARGALGLQFGVFTTGSAPNAEVFDTVGAGDAFNAGYLAARLQRRGLEQSLLAGCQTATRMIAQFPRRYLTNGAAVA